VAEINKKGSIAKKIITNADKTPLSPKIFDILPKSKTDKPCETAMIILINSKDCEDEATNVEKIKNGKPIVL
jgi:hypothetical protein